MCKERGDAGGGGHGAAIPYPQCAATETAGSTSEIRLVRSGSEINELHQPGPSSCLKQRAAVADGYMKVGK